MKATGIVRAIAAALIIAGLITSYWCGTALIDVQHRIETYSTLLSSNDQLCNVLLNAETGQRGFLLTGSEGYLEPYHGARADLPVVIAAIDKLALNPKQSQFRDEMEPIVLAKMNELARTIVLRREAGFSAAMEVVRTDEGKGEMDRLRTMFAEQRTYTEGAIATLRRIGTSLVGGVITGLTFVILGILALFLRAKPREKVTAETKAATYL